MKFIFYTILLYIHSFTVCSATPDENALLIPDKKTVIVTYKPELTFTPYNDNRHTVTINNIDAECPCLQLYGENLRECMKAQSRESAMRHFKRFSVRTAKYYLLLLQMNEFREFLSLFSETEWQIFLNQLRPEDRSQMPQTVKEQLDVIPEAHLDSYNKQFFGYHHYYTVSEPRGSESWWNEMRRRQMMQNYQEEHLRRTFQQIKKQLYTKP